MNVMRPRTDKIEISGNLLTGVFHIYIFKQANAYIAYCPSIDLAVSGNSIRNAEESFQESVSIHLDYQIKNKELLKDLKKHKWKRLYLIKNKKSRCKLSVKGERMKIGWEAILPFHPGVKYAILFSVSLNL